MEKFDLYRDIASRTHLLIAPRRAHLPALLAFGIAYRILYDIADAVDEPYVDAQSLGDKIDIETCLLPSTSPANFKFDIDKWRDALADN